MFLTACCVKTLCQARVSVVLPCASLSLEEIKPFINGDRLTNAPFLSPSSHRDIRGHTGHLWWIRGLYHSNVDALDGFRASKLLCRWRLRGSEEELSLATETITKLRKEVDELAKSKKSVRGNLFTNSEASTTITAPTSSPTSLQYNTSPEDTDEHRFNPPLYVISHCTVSGNRYTKQLQDANFAYKQRRCNAIGVNCYLHEHDIHSAHDAYLNRGKQWDKVVSFRDVLKTLPENHWFLWLDCDAIFTSTSLDTFYELTNTDRAE